MASYGWISFITLVSYPIFSLSQSEPVVKTPLGSIRGTMRESKRGANFYSFLGIRYAEPPVKNLRFKPPVPVKPWTDTFDGTKDGPACMQRFWGKMSEDCLRLNVHTHHVNDDVPKLKPVLVFIHGGEFDSFTGQSFMFGPEFLMDHDIVVVTINYRLGTLGFFSTGDEHAPGNYGMKDQVEALRWVKNNIHAFGGDPEKVTIAGYNAGAASVILHLLSPMSKDLFHGAIAMSSSALNNWTITRNPLGLAHHQAGILGCPTDNSQAMVDCIKELPAKNVSKIIPQLKGYRDNPFAALTPVIEVENDEKEQFLSKDPLDLLKEGKFANVPLMIGTTKDELAYKASDLMYDEELVSKLSTDWNEVAPIVFSYDGSDSEISEKIREFYLKNTDEPLTNHSVEGLAQLYSDSLSIFGVIRTAKLISDQNDQPVYLYQFNYEIKRHRQDLDDHEVNQFSDVQLIFKTPFRPTENDSVEDRLISDKLTVLWKNFMQTGNPTPAELDILDNVKWTPFKSSSPSYLYINKKLTVVEKLYYEDRISFWENLFPL